SLFFHFTAPAPTETHTLSLHDALPISSSERARRFSRRERRRTAKIAAESVAATADPISMPSRVLRPKISFAASPARTAVRAVPTDRKSTRLNSSHDQISYAVFCLKKKT